VIFLKKPKIIVVVDTETSGPLRTFRGLVPYHNLLEIGAVEVVLGTIPTICRTFYVMLKPLTEYYDSESMEYTSGKTLKYYSENGEKPKEAIEKFVEFLLDIKSVTKKKVLLASDNPEFDVGWIRLYLELYGYDAGEILHHNPMSIKDLARGLMRNLRTNLYNLPTKFRVPALHSHNALDDALRNAEIFVKLLQELSYSQ